MLFLREEDHGECRAGKAAMEGHAAVPDLQGAQRIGGDIGEIVEEDVADASA